MGKGGMKNRCWIYLSAALVASMVCLTTKGTWCSSHVQSYVANEVARDVHDFSVDQDVVLSKFSQILNCTNVFKMIQWSDKTDIVACVIVSNEMALIYRKHPFVMRPLKDGEVRINALSLRFHKTILLPREVADYQKFIRDVGDFKYFSFGRYMGGVQRFYVFENKVGKMKLVNFFDRPPFRSPEYKNFPRKGHAEDFIDNHSQYIYQLFLNFLIIIDSKCSSIEDNQDIYEKADIRN
ncbi:MAG: hypothetical protein IJL17_18070 [Kiritimatiellae bacterium]|nr:hypothetical protein [Kiritimatiellia bacterium]